MQVYLFNYLFVFGLFFSFGVQVFGAPKSCALPYGGTIAHNSSVTLYQSAIAAYGTQCLSQLRICKNGVLSGSYTNQTCTVAAAPPPPTGSLPVINFTQVPVNNTTSTVDQISFNFSTTSTNRTVQCSLDSAVFSNCTSPVAVMVMVGSHNFRVRVTDVTYNLSTTVTHSWSVIAAPPPSNYLPYVNTSLYPTPAIGYSTLRVAPTSEIPTSGNGGGQFRIACEFSHMANNDPIVFPGGVGASHSHSFFGNTAVNASSTPETLRLSGNSTCTGGLMNRSSYWVPTVVDSRTGTPIIPRANLIYYKTGSVSEVVAPPAGLRMIANGSINPTGLTPQPWDRHNRFTCNGDYNTRQQSMHNCPTGSSMEWLMSFPECWDGKNLDSADHKSHMSYPLEGGACPATHPVRIPVISFNIYYDVNTTEGTKYWRFSSDNYPTTSPGGYSGHGDWMNGWDEAFMAVFVKSCLKAGVDCHAHLLGDGRMFY